MKLKYSIIIMLFLSTIINAQIISNFGIKTAFTRSKLNIENFTNYSTWRSGINIAIFGEYNLLNFISIGSQIEYNQKGYISEQVETNEVGAKIQDVRANTRLDYISFPIYMKIKYPTYKLKPFVILGPRYDYLFNYNKGKFRFTSVTVTDNMAKYFKSYVIGGSISTGVQIPISKNYDISTEFRYNFDYTNSAKAPIEYSIKNKTFDIWLGLEF